MCAYIRVRVRALRSQREHLMTQMCVYSVVPLNDPSICQVKSSFIPDVQHVGELISRCYEEKTYCVRLTHPLHLLLDTISRRTRDAPASRATRQAAQRRVLSIGAYSPAHVMKGFYPQVMKADTKYNLMHSKTVSASSLH